jgi:hypothetical protein
MGTVPKFATSAADGLVRASVRLAAQRGEVGVTHENARGSTQSRTL